jgi:uncharacterized DUF497 family protein
LLGLFKRAQAGHFSRAMKDEAKAEKVKAERGVDFAQIIDVFDDYYAVEFIDEEHSTSDETRYAIIGLSGLSLIFLVYTEPDVDEVRFVTARFAEKWMVDEYEENKQSK